MNKFFILLVTAFLLFSCGTDSKEQAVQAIKDAQEYLTPFENGNGNQTATYEEVIAFYKKLAADFASIQLEEIGLTDSGKPLHLISFSKKSIDWGSANEDKIKILINNGIHPGESDGIDASLMLLRDLATGKVNAPDNFDF